MNRYNLDKELTDDEYRRYYLLNGVDYNLGRRCQEYFLAYEEFNLDAGEAADRLEKAHGSDPDEGHFDFLGRGYCSGAGLITDNEDLASELIRVLELDFVHDFKSGLFFFDLFGMHELLMGYTFAATGKDTGDTGRNAELYVEKGLGCFNSSQSQWIYFGEDVAVPRLYSTFKNRIRRR